ncbi:hypothetical protein PspLS_08086 [Pyricularia sp. CBS 133598]|nr:hypothetical protein PspLS_08086 [Pyricularia sp. CBS 133598]
MAHSDLQGQTAEMGDKLGHPMARHRAAVAGSTRSAGLLGLSTQRKEAVTTCAEPDDGMSLNKERAEAVSKRYALGVHFLAAPLRHARRPQRAVAGQGLKKRSDPPEKPAGRPCRPVRELHVPLPSVSLPRKPYRGIVIACIAFVGRTIEWSRVIEAGGKTVSCRWNAGQGTFGDDGTPLYRYRSKRSKPGRDTQLLSRTVASGDFTRVPSLLASLSQRGGTGPVMERSNLPPIDGPLPYQKLPLTPLRGQYSNNYVGGRLLTKLEAACIMYDEFLVGFNVTTIRVATSSDFFEALPTTAQAIVDGGGPALSTFYCCIYVLCTPVLLCRSLAWYILNRRCQSIRHQVLGLL